MTDCCCVSTPRFTHLLGCEPVDHAEARAQVHDDGHGWCRRPAEQQVHEEQLGELRGPATHRVQQKGMEDSQKASSNAREALRASPAGMAVAVGGPHFDTPPLITQPDATYRWRTGSCLMGAPRLASNAGLMGGLSRSSRRRLPVWPSHGQAEARSVFPRFVKPRPLRTG